MQQKPAEDSGKGDIFQPILTLGLHRTTLSILLGDGTRWHSHTIWRIIASVLLVIALVFMYPQVYPPNMLPVYFGRRGVRWQRD